MRASNESSWLAVEKRKQALTQERLCSVLRYDAATGFFWWRVGAGLRMQAGGRAGNEDDEGYRKIRIDRRAYREHRLVWLYVFGHWPPALIDHINGVRADNRLENLRDATRFQNQANRGPTEASRTGVKGVFATPGPYFAQIKVAGKNKHLGYFQTLEAATLAYRNAEIKFFGSFAQTQREPLAVSGGSLVDLLDVVPIEELKLIPGCNP